jgi:hypothetical protein
MRSGKWWMVVCGAASWRKRIWKVEWRRKTMESGRLQIHYLAVKVAGGADEKKGSGKWELHLPE